MALAEFNRSGTRRDRRAVDPVSMRHNHAIAGAVVAALLAWFDVVGCAQCVAYCWPYFGLKSFLIAGIIRSKFKSATPAARAGLPALRYGWSPYEFIGGNDVGLVFYPGAAVEAAAYAPLCRRVAEEAKATVVLARPPLRFAITTAGFRKLTARHPGIKTWAVGGHSHGGGTLGAMMVADEASSEEIRGLAMLGASPMAWGRDTDLAARRDLEVVNVMASEDEICSPKPGAVLRYGGGLVEEEFKNLPKSTRRVVIKGGNHASDAASEALYAIDATRCFAQGLRGLWHPGLRRRADDQPRGPAGPNYKTPRRVPAARQEARVVVRDP